MASFYKITHGHSLHSGRLWEILNLDDYDVGRYRDLYARDGKIILLTRNGGDNRPLYEGVFQALAKHPCYVKDYDCPEDVSFAEIVFKVPEGFEEEVEKYE